MNRFERLRTNCALMLMSVAATLAGHKAEAGQTAFAKVIVTTLEDYNPYGEPAIPGSLRYALEQARGPRTITFAVGGEILLHMKLVVSEPFVTIDGTSAPKPGITIERWQTEVYNTHDVVLRNLRIRSGDGFKTIEERRAVHGAYDSYTSGGGWRSLCIWADGGALTSSVTVENCSIQNSTDDNGAVWGNCRRILFRNCLFSGGHFSHKQMLAGWDLGETPVCYPDWLTVDGCVFTGGPGTVDENRSARMPDAMGGTVTLTRSIVVWPYQGSRFTMARVNMIGNYFVEIPNHPWGANRDRVVCVTGDAEPGSIYVSGNYVNGKLCSDNRLFGFPNLNQTDIPATDYRAQAWNVWPASAAVRVDINATKRDVLAQAGCVSPMRDQLDLDTIKDAQEKIMPSGSDKPNGDMNGDGVVNGLDLQGMVNAALSSSPIPGVIARGDLNGNGMINSDDAALLAQSLVASSK